MARSHARVFTSIWDDADFLARSSLAQRCYLMLLSQPNLSHAGILPTTFRRWALLSADEDEGALRAAMSELAEHRFVVVDERTEEMLIRSLIRNDGVWKQPKVLAVAITEASSTRSAILRSCLADELSRLDDLSSLPESTRPAVEVLLKDLPHRLVNAHLELDDQVGANPPVNPLPDPPANGVRVRARAAPTPATVPIPGPVPPPAVAGKPRDSSAADTLPGAPEKPETAGQRVNRLADEWCGLVPMSNHQAAAQIIRKAVNANVDDAMIIAALQKLAAENRGLTTETLRVAIYGPPKNGSRGGASDDLSGEDYSDGGTIL